MTIVAILLTIFLIVVVLLAATILFVSQRKAKGNNSEIIRNALVRLLKRPYGAYVIIEEPSTGKFVQFSGSSEEPLFFDLPQQTLTLEEFEKARNLFRDLGFPGPETFEVYEYSSGLAAGTQTSFNVSFGNDIEKATELAIEVLEKVYGFENSVKLKLTEK